MSKWGQTLALLKQQQQRTLSEQAPPPPQRMFSMQIGSPDWQVAGRVEAPAPATQELLEPRYPPPKEVIDERGAVPIKMFAHVMSLSGIDSKEQRFEVELFVQLEWTVRLPSSQVDSKTAWRPRPSWIGSSRECKLETSESFRAVPEGEVTRCFLTLNVHGVFLHRFDLRRFPFDQHTLPVEMYFWHSPLERVVTPARDGQPEVCRPFRGRLAFESGVNMFYSDRFIQSDVWYADEDTAVTMVPGHTNEDHRSTADGQRFSTLTVRIAISRRVVFYIFNAYLVFDIFVLTTFTSFAALAVDGGMTNRAQITFAMVLAAVAYKMAISGTTPHTGYLTALDVFVFAAFSVMAAVTVQNVVCALLNQHYGPEVAHRFNVASAFTITSVWGAFQLVLPWSFYLARKEQAMLKTQVKLADETNQRRWRLSKEPDAEAAAAARPVSRGFASPRKVRLDGLAEAAAAAKTP